MADFECGMEGDGALSVISFGKKLASKLDELLFPAHCLACGVFGAWICARCESSVQWINGSLEAPLLPSGTKPAISRYWALAPYPNRAVQSLIHGLKYQAATCLEGMLERWFLLFMQRHGEALPWIREESWVIIPVPTAPSHVRERGIDHGHVLAKMLQRTTPALSFVVGLAARVEETGFANAELEDERLREANVMRAWQIKGAVPERVLLVDDVYTTGSTVQSLARVLLEAGVKKIEVLTIATGGR